MYQVIKNIADGKITGWFDRGVDTALSFDADVSVSTEYADFSSALAAEPSLSGTIQSVETLAALPTSPPRFDAAVHIGDVWAGHPTTTTIAGSNIASAIFDGEFLVVVFAQPWEDADYNLKTILSGTGFADITQAVTAKTAAGFTLQLTEGAAAPQDITVAIRVK